MNYFDLEPWIGKKVKLHQNNIGFITEESVKEKNKEGKEVDIYFVSVVTKTIATDPKTKNVNPITFIYRTENKDEAKDFKNQFTGGLA